MADVTVLDAEPIGKDVVETLELALNRARNGELSSVAIAAVKRDGSPYWVNSAAPNKSTLIGVIERMKQDIIHDANQV
jgi:hypothetical protein